MRNSIDKQFDSVREFVSIMTLVAGLFGLALLATPAWSHPPEDPAHHHEKDSGTKHGSLGNIGAKLADPTSNIWAMAMSINAPAFYDGNFNSGDSKVGGAMAVHPIMPIPLYGEGKDQWKLAIWERFYNNDRPHGAHKGKTPYEVLREELN